MEALALVNELRSRGVELEAAGDRLRYRPREAVSPDEAEALLQHKAGVLEVLRRHHAPRCDCETWHGFTIHSVACPECNSTSLCPTCRGCRWCWFQDIRIGRLSE